MFMHNLLDYRLKKALSCQTNMKKSHINPSTYPFFFFLENNALPSAYQELMSLWFVSGSCSCVSALSTFVQIS